MTRLAFRLENEMYIGVPCLRTYYSEDYTTQKWACYRGTVEPVASRLRGLKDFFMRISCPLKIAKVKVRDGMELELERMVMGTSMIVLREGRR